MMQERDEARNKLKNSPVERKALLMNYRRLRNKATLQISCVMLSMKLANFNQLLTYNVVQAYLLST